MSSPSDAYLSICERFGRWLATSRVAEPGDWLLPRESGARSPRLATERQPVPDDEILVPRLERLLAELRAETAAFVLDFSNSEFACVAFDEQGRTLANVVAGDPAAAVAQALVFIRAERAANERASERR
ncbi:MAG: hypothetical protein RMK01_06210 [Thermomicrobium sp.]|nr:hypothetical protein [Thermomicrobium sp.]MDW8059651.1 hypothetical protein [Thermomicrobium sp.]